MIKLLDIVIKAECFFYLFIYIFITTNNKIEMTAFAGLKINEHQTTHTNITCLRKKTLFRSTY